MTTADAGPTALNAPSPAAAPGTPPADGAPVLHAFAAGPVLAMAAATAVVLVGLSSLYGYHRDEFYYLWGGEHLSWGYVDHPPVVPLVARVADVVGGHTLVVLRAVPALIAAWLVIAGGLVARELGGNRRAQVIAAFAVMCVPATRGPEALYGTTAADAAVWAVVLVLFVRLLRTERTGLWLWLGLVVGIGLETKWSVLILVAGLVVGLLCTPGRRLLASPLAVAGGALALALWVPNLWWNATHDWAFLEFQRSVARQNGGLDDRLLFFPLLLLLTGLAPIVVWLPGWRALFRDRRFRAVAIAPVVMAAAVFLAAGKAYYVAPVIIPLLAAGAIVLDRAAPRRRHAAIWILAVTGLLTIPLTVPILPPAALNAVTPINPELAEMVGWPELAASARQAFDALPADERAHTVILTDNYGTAGAISRDDPELPVYSSQNSHWFDGPPPASATTVLAVGLRAPALDFCGSTQPVGTIANPFGLHNKEEGRPIIVCRSLREPWPALWERLKSFS